jgi:RNA polymerase sigma factor FliA
MLNPEIEQVWVAVRESRCVGNDLKLPRRVADTTIGEHFPKFLLKFFDDLVDDSCVLETNLRESKNMGEMTLEEINARIEEHLPLVKHVVFQVAVHFPRHVDREELARAGALGLVEASRRFDAERGVPFERFAAQRIRGSILDSVRAADWAPRSVRLLARRLEATEQHLASELGRIPSVSEMAQELGVGVDELSRLQDRLFRSVVLALDHETSDDTDEDLTLVDVLRDRSAVDPADELESRELHAYLRDAVKLLPERQRLVIIGYFLEGKTSQDLARFLGVTESRISQLRSEALRNLKLGIDSQYVNDDKTEPAGRVAKRQDAYADSVRAESGWKNRLGRWDTRYDIPEEPLLPVGRA